LWQHPTVRLEDRVAIITGAARGIGKAYAERFLDEGARVVIADISEEDGEAAAKELSSKGEVAFVRVDVSDEQSVDDCVRATTDRFGSVDILLNNAALYGELDRGDQTFDYLHRVFDVNLHSAWLMTRAASPAMVAAGRGRIINQSSDAAYMIAPEAFIEPDFGGLKGFGYNQTKWGLVGLTKFCAIQLGQYGITVNCIAPGVVLTDATQATLAEERQEELRRRSSMHRSLEPRHLTGAAVFFASDDAELVTGQVLCVDAGMCMPA
jgi:NAD(P)-dependent dehydrogenase (short-subunit alcohol dehydrogenase family)